MNPQPQDGQSITTDLRDVIPKGMILKPVFNRNRLVIRSFTVKGILGLDARVDFDDRITNLTSLGSQGRSRFLRCLHAFRIMCFCPSYDMQPNMINGKIDEHSKMSMTVSTATPEERDFSMTIDIDFIKKHNDRYDEDYFVNAITWTLFDEDGDRVYYGNGKIEPEEVDEFYNFAIEEVKRFLEHGIIQTLDEAMSHLGGMPYDVLRIIAVHGPTDISANIGRLMPWLCVFADTTMNRTVILDDIFDSIHPCVVMNMTEQIDSSHGRRQVIMSCRRPEGLVSDSPCYVFDDGHAIKISKTKPARLYAFDGEDDYTSWIQYVKDGSIFDTIEKMFRESK